MPHTLPSRVRAPLSNWLTEYALACTLQISSDVVHAHLEPHDRILYLAEFPGDGGGQITINLMVAYYRAGFTDRRLTTFTLPAIRKTHHEFSRLQTHDMP